MRSLCVSCYCPIVCVRPHHPHGLLFPVFTVMQNLSVSLCLYLSLSHIYICKDLPSEHIALVPRPMRTVYPWLSLLVPTSQLCERLGVFMVDGNQPNPVSDVALSRSCHSRRLSNSPGAEMLTICHFSFAAALIANRADSTLSANSVLRRKSSFFGGTCGCLHQWRINTYSI